LPRDPEGRSASRGVVQAAAIEAMEQMFEAAPLADDG
jgi:hypothetical protein